MSGSEYRLLFEHDNMGYVRFLDRLNTSFQLDPSPFLLNPHNEIYRVGEGCPMPPKGKLIEATVRETEKKAIRVGNQNEFDYLNTKYVMDWKLVDPNKLLYNRLVNKEEFLNFLSLPIPKTSYDIEDLKQCLGMYMVSSPKMTEFEPGGVNAIVLGGKHARTSWAAFKRSAKIVPKEFRFPSSSHFYKSSESAERPRPINSCEVSMAYLEIQGCTYPHSFTFKFNAEKLLLLSRRIRTFPAYCKDVSTRCHSVSAGDPTDASKETGRNDV